MAIQNSIITFRGNLQRNLQGYKMRYDQATRLRNFNFDAVSTNVKTKPSYRALRACSAEFTAAAGFVSNVYYGCVDYDTAMRKAGRQQARITKAALAYLRSTPYVDGVHQFPFTNETLKAMCDICNKESRNNLRDYIPVAGYNQGDSSLVIETAPILSGWAASHPQYDGLNISSVKPIGVIPPRLELVGEEVVCHPGYWTVPPDDYEDYNGWTENLDFASAPSTIKIEMFHKPEVDTGIYKDFYWVQGIVVTPYKYIGSKKVFFASDGAFGCYTFPNIA